MKKTCFIAAIVMGVFVSGIQAQDTLYFKEGLMANGIHKYGREALYTDLLVYQMYNGALQRPADGNVLGRNNDGEEIKWMSVAADSLNRFRLPRSAMGAMRRGGGMFSNSSYLYFRQRKKCIAEYKRKQHGICERNTSCRGSLCIGLVVHSG
ncbi:MAG: hypothetical protein KF746_02830 [Chitinophagaceae bacterium]|nr:hypothetical protein [Chitinophagaceae bacterium]